MSSLVIEGKPIEGRVAAILSAKRLVINRGSEQGVQAGQVYAVLTETPLEIRDPESGKLLDKLDREKVRVKVTEVRPSVAICETYRVIQGVDLRPFIHLDIFKAAREPTPERLEIDDNAMPHPIPESERFVKINDRVRFVST